jgi:hypothetical protein
MPKKTFTAGEVLTASDVNTFLMDQSVMTFADSAARGSAIGTATEGMVTYLEDTDGLELWNGTAWTGVGGGGATNAIINGAFEINQRGFTSSTANSAYGFDRFQLTTTDGTGTYSSESFTPGELSVPSFGQPLKYARLVTTGQTLSSARTLIAQGIEKVETLANQTGTVSFWAKAASGTPKVAVELLQVFGTTGSTAVSTVAGQVTLSTSWARYSVTASIPSISGKTIAGDADRLVVLLWASAGADFNARTGSLGIQSNTFDIWGLQVEAGSTATPFKRNANSLEGELAACQRYYYRSQSAAPFLIHSTSGIATNATTVGFVVQHPVTMRIGPTSVDFSTLLSNDGYSFGSPVTAVTLNQVGPRTALVTATTSGMTTGRFYRLESNNSTSAFIGFSAEL